MTPSGGEMALESVDGKTLYYNRSGALYSTPVAGGGVEHRVVDSLMYWAFAPAKTGISYVVRPDPHREQSYEIRRLSFAPVKTETLHPFPSLGSTFLLSVSPDEQTLMLDGISPAKNDDLMLIHNFR